ncbi:MAG: hypothetical protein JNJ54_37460 [Myxococcaceae bacterium]|nr:hypothetical protein [Myxococcaceae bacterium]
MRSLLSGLLLLLGVATSAEAKCAGEWLDVLPAGEVELPKEPHVLVRLGGRLEKHDPGKDLEWTAGAQHVGVKVVTSFKGYSQQVSLVKPERALQPGKWTLAFKKDPKLAELAGRVVGTWRVSEEADSTPPALTGTPALKDTSWQEYGCGPGSSITLSGAGVNEPHAFIEAAVTVGGVTTVAVLGRRDDLVELGHGMCSGNFDLAPGTKATVVLTPIDLAGNRGAKSAPIDVTAPGPKP